MYMTGIKTIFQTHDPEDGSKYIPISTIQGAALPVGHNAKLVIDGQRYWVVRHEVIIGALEPQFINVVVTVVKDD